MAVNKRITSDTAVTISELAVVLGITTRRIRQLVEEGILIPAGKNTYPLSDCVQKYIRFLKSSMPEETDVALETKRKKAEVELKVSKAKIASLQAEELEGTMHRSEDVAELTEDLIFTIRSALMALPGRLAVNVAPVSTAAEASDIIRKEVHLIMEELSQYKYDPEQYAQKVRERMEWSGQGTGDDDE